MFVIDADTEKCTNCKSFICVEECPNNALFYDFNRLFYSYHECSFCESCFNVCEYKAISLVEVNKNV